MDKKFVIEFENLMKEWDWDKNNELGLFPNKLTFGSTKKVWWKCSKCGCEWSVSPNSRTSGGTGCPGCAGLKVVAGVNDLQTLYPNIARRWHPTLNRKKPSEIVPFSNKKAWWICEKDERHVFESVICSVVKGDTNCPVCSNYQIIAGVNDFATTCPNLLKEWDWNKNNQLGIFPTQISRGLNKKVWWKCSTCGNEWQATVSSRSGKQRCGCPKCKRDLSSSYPEKAIAYYLSKEFSVDENKKFSWLGQSEIDIYIGELKLGIEYDGKAWHKNIDRDLKKDELCNKHGIQLIRIRENGCPKYNSVAHKISRKSTKESDLQNVIEQILRYIIGVYNKPLNIAVDIDKDYIDILQKIATGKKDKSVASSKLIDSWNWDKNKNISPENIKLGSKRKLWWKCEKGHEWQAAVSSRSGKGSCGCPICAGQQVLPGYNDLQTIYPEIAKCWDYSKNEKKPSEVMPMDNRKYWWICQSCGKSYLTAVCKRTTRTQVCPDCARQNTVASHFKKVINVDTTQVFNSIKEASEKTGVRAGDISSCCRGKRKSAGGYHWSFVNKEQNQ